MNTTTDTYKELLETWGERMTPVLQLWGASSNYEHPAPYVKFLDLIGYTAREFGTTLYETGADHQLGHLELDMIADAIKCWAVRPGDVENMIDQIERLED